MPAQRRMPVATMPATAAGPCRRANANDPDGPTSVPAPALRLASGSSSVPLRVAPVAYARGRPERNPEIRGVAWLRFLSG